MNKKIQKLLEELSEQLESVLWKSVGASDCHGAPAYKTNPAKGVRKAAYICAWCGKDCKLQKPDHGA